MIPVPRPKATPKGFAERCTERGRRWLETHPLDPLGEGPEPLNDWREFEPQLREVFRERCGWLAMWVPDQGSVLSAVWT